MTTPIHTSSATNAGTTSAWAATATVPEFPPLMGTEHADVCVIGAGIAASSAC